MLERGGWKHIHSSPAAIWVMMLNRDISIVQSQVDLKHTAARLRTSHDCEATKYELYVLAAYVEAGARIETTDSRRTGEFKVSQGGGWVHVECKHKSTSWRSSRNVKHVFDKGADSLKALMDRKGTRVLALIACNTDPKEREIDKLVDIVERMLDASSDYERQGKFEVSLLPSEWVTAVGGTRFPAGYDGFSEATAREDAEGNRVLADGWGVGWRVDHPSGWIRSTVGSFKQAASQLPEESPNLVYVELPEGELGTVQTRIDSVQPHIEQLLKGVRHTRVNAVVLTGQALIQDWPAPGVATTRYIYSTSRNPSPSENLPERFRVFGDDFTRKRDD